MEYFTLLIGICNIGQIPLAIIQILIARKQLIKSRTTKNNVVNVHVTNLRQPHAEGFDNRSEDMEVEARSMTDALKLYKDGKRAIRQGDMLTDYQFVEDFWWRMRSGFTLLFLASICFISGVFSTTPNNLLILVSALPGITGFCILQCSFARLERRFPARAKVRSTK